MAKDSLEGMAILGLLDDLQHVLVKSEGERAREDGQGRIRNDGHDGDDGEREEDGQDSAQDYAALARVAPVNQVENCQKKSTNVKSQNSSNSWTIVSVSR